jgi:hypothetical protein
MGESFKGFMLLHLDFWYNALSLNDTNFFKNYEIICIIIR